MEFLSNSREFLLGDKKYHLIESLDQYLASARVKSKKAGWKKGLKSSDLKIVENKISTANIENTELGDFSNKSFFKVSLETVAIKNVDFSKIRLCDTSFKNSTIENADFRDGNIEKVKFENCYLKNCIFPDDLKEFQFIDCRRDF